MMKINKSMIERIMEAKRNNNKIEHPSWDTENTIENNSDNYSEKESLNKEINNKITESRNKLIPFKHKTSESIHIKPPIPYHNINKTISSSKITKNIKSQKSTQFYIGTMLKKGIYKPFVSQSLNISAQKNWKRSLSNRSSRSVSPILPMRFTANWTPVKKLIKPTYNQNKIPLKMKMWPSIQRTKYNFVCVDLPYLNWKFCLINRIFLIIDFY